MEALGRKLLTVTEVNGHGSVPELRVNNQADVPVLLVDGEELLGAKQNRILNSSVLLQEHKEPSIPVSCVEHGRWRYVSNEFRHAGHVMAHAMRKMKVSIGDAQTKGAKLAKTFNALPAAERELVSDIIEGELRAGVTPPYWLYLTHKCSD